MLLSWSAFAYLTGLIAMLTAIFRKGRRRWPLAIGCTLIVGTALLRLVSTGTGAVSFERVTGSRSAPNVAHGRGGDASTSGDDPSSPATDLLARLVSERDVAIAGATALLAAGRLNDPEADRLPGALARAYDRMFESMGPFPTPTFGTMLGDSDDDDFELFVVEPERPATDTVVFLHGYAGNFAIQCWHTAHAFEPISPRTLCPSVGFEGDWGTPRGGRILDAVLASARAEGAERIYLVGLSNGARGAASLARSRGAELDGVVVISGAAGTPPPSGTPVLAIQGTRDRMFPARHARAYARAAGPRGTWAPIDGGHFIYLDRYEEVLNSIRSWLSEVR